MHLCCSHVARQRLILISIFYLHTLRSTYFYRVLNCNNLEEIPENLNIKFHIKYLRIFVRSANLLLADIIFTKNIYEIDSANRSSLPR